MRDRPERLKRPLVIPVFLPHQGCPHRCVFCRQTVITGQPDRLPDGDAIARTVEQHLATRSSQRGKVEVAFYGGNFLGLTEDRITGALDAVMPFVRQSRIDGIRFSTRPDTVRPETLALLSGYPISTVELGVQSMHDRLLAACERGHTAADTRRAVQRLSVMGCRLGLQLMTGLPGETAEDALDSARAAAALIPDFVRLYPLLVLAGTPLAAMWRRGDYRAIPLDEAVQRVKRMVVYFHHQGIAVVRMGLQTTPALQADGQLLAGPHHPAFGELVMSACFFDLAVAIMDAAQPTADRVVLRVHPRSESQLRGHRNTNLRRLNRRYADTTVVIAADPRLPGDGLAVDGKPAVRISDLEGLTD